MKKPSAGQLDECRARAQNVAMLLRLPFRRRAWRGVQGNWQGLGTGSSLDFQDHRPYAPGDDPRYINWQAYARSGHYTMKLYRQEVSPALDLLVDCSASMFVDEQKSLRVAELLYWCVESGIHAGAAVRVYCWRSEAAEPVAMDAVEAHGWLEISPSGEHSPALPNVPWRQGSLRVLVSDLLWPGDSQPLFSALNEHHGCGVVLAPYSPEEARPRWDGNLEMVDCESSKLRVQRVNASVRDQYTTAYRRHFSLWEEQALRYHVPLARVAAGVELAEALRFHAVENGAVEWAD